MRPDVGTVHKPIFEGLLMKRVLLYAVINTLPPLPARDIAVAVLGGGGFVVYVIWIVLLLRRVRPALARRLSALLGVPIEERGRGQWAAAPHAPRALGCIVALADLAILLLGGLGPLVLLSLAVLLLGGP
jgi:hypothetical protein